MAMRSRTTFKKRQKELARQEKQRDKAARRVQRKLEKNSPETEDGVIDGEDGAAEEGIGVDSEDALEPVAASDALEPVASSPATAGAHSSSEAQ